MTTNDQIRERIRVAMMRVGVTSATALAKELGIPATTVIKKMSGEQKVSVLMLTLMIEKWPELSAEWLLTGRESPQWHNPAQEARNAATEAENAHLRHKVEALRQETHDLMDIITAKDAEIEALRGENRDERRSFQK